MRAVKPVPMARVLGGSLLRWALIALAVITTLELAPTPVLALNPSVDVSQYAHTSWTVRDGFSLGATFAMAQTPDGYLWLGSEFGLFRFDGVRIVQWKPPAGQQLPDKPYSLLVTRDGTLWVGTFKGLVSWNGSSLTQHPELENQFVTSLLEDHEGTVWAGTIAEGKGGQLCAVRSDRAQCYGNDGAFGSFVWSLGEDSSGTLWAGAESGLWRWKPGPPRRYATSAGKRVGDMIPSGDGQLLFGITGAGLVRFVADRIKPYPIRSPMNRDALLPDQDVNSNKLLRDRDGGLWVGTRDHGIIHIQNGRTDVFTKADGLSGDITCSLFEDREGNVWYASSQGLDRFRALPVTTVSSKQGLSSDTAESVLAATDGSIWVGTHHGLTRFQNAQKTVFRKRTGLPDDVVQSLYGDENGRVWAFTDRGLAYFKDGRFVAVTGVPSNEVYSISGEADGDLWLSGNKGLSHMREGNLAEHFPWSALGRRQQAKVVVADQGGVWLSFWLDGGVVYFKDGRVRASYTTADGLGKGHVPGLRLDRDGALWAATDEGGLSRIKDGRIATITAKNGLPCDTIHWSMEDDERSLWVYAACDLVRITRSELDAWIADPTHRIQTTLWDATDGVRLRALAPSFGPTVAKSADGKLWYLTGEGVQVVDPRQLSFNKITPPVHIQRIIANHKTYWQDLPGAAVSNLRLPSRIQDLQIEFTALSLVAPEKVHFRYKLEGQDHAWREVVNQHQAQYTNLAPGSYRFRVIACNNSGAWNEQGDTLEFSIAPAFYQSNWFRGVCAVLFIGLLWAAHRFRVRQLRHQFAMTLDARVAERTRIARDLHDTLLQGAHGVLLRFQTVSQLLPDRAIEAKDKLDSAIDLTAEFITEARNEVQGLRDSSFQINDLAQAIRTLGEELETDPARHRPEFHVAVEGESRNLHPIVRDEIYKIAAEALRNAFRHAQARQVEVEIRYDHEQFRLRVRDDGKGIDRAILSRQSTEGHYGLPGMRERATLIGGKLTVWSEIDAGTEVELCIPGRTAYEAFRQRSWLTRKFAAKA